MPVIEALTRTCESLLTNLETVLRQGPGGGNPRAVQDLLEKHLQGGSLELPEGCYSPTPKSYGRHLLHRDPTLGFSVVVMTWGPGQRTPLHDHAGLWCVEGVVQGRICISDYELSDRRGDLFRFRPLRRVEAGVGVTGCLIPPAEHHVVENALPRETSVTVHIYGGEMSECTAFEPLEDGWYHQRRIPLSYTNEP